MEIEGEDGTKLSLKPGVNSVFGRESEFNTDDLSVSRRHISLQLTVGTEPSESVRVSFEVLGRNPVWVRTGDKVRTFRKSETGEICPGDRFCVSGRHPIWFDLKRQQHEVMEERVVIFKDVDPVKEFGFLVIGGEFDQYPKSRMRDVKQWEWFLEDFRNGNSDDDDDDDDDDKKGRKGLGKKRGRKKGNEDDDDWGVESEEDKEVIVKSKGVKSSSYSTRSKKSKRDVDASSSSGHAQTKQRGRVDDNDDDDDDDDDNEEDETLGGFIVTDEEEDKLNIDDDEEEEVVSDDDDDED